MTLKILWALIKIATKKIGEGHIGIDAIARIVTHPKLTNLPFYLETPNDLDGYAKEIAMLRSIVENQ